MRLADFIEQHREDILREAQTFTAGLLPAAGHLDAEAMRDHLPLMLKAICADLRSAQSSREQAEKSKGLGPAASDWQDSAAETHAILRAKAGFNIDQVVAEYRALRASVLRLWFTADSKADAPAIDDMTRFNEAIDQALAESVASFSIETERWRNIFLAVLGHDLRGPLNAVLLTAELLSRVGAEVPASRYTEGLIRSGRRMQQLLDSLLDYSRTSLGRGIAVTRTEVDLAEACREELDVVRAALPGYVIELEVAGPTMGQFDASRLREALSNLAFNAAKYSPQGTAIHVRLSGDGDSIRLSVENAGTIETADLQLIFEPLRRGGTESPNALSERTSLGLGLFIVQEIARSHGGSVAASSEHGQTVFTMTLPVAVPA